MPPPLPEEEEGEEKSLPKPKPKPKPKPPKPMPARPEPRRDVTASAGDGGGTLPPDPALCGDSCAGTCGLLPHCQPPPSPAATTVHLSSTRLPTPLIAVSASLLAFLAVLLVALLVRRLLRQRRRRARNAALLALHGGEGAQVLAGAVAAGEVLGEEEDEEAADGGVHHVWYIRTKGLDERAIAAIAAVVYDAKKRGAMAGDGGDDASCAVCLAEFRDGETLRLLPRCGHPFHRACIDTWLRAHVNCPLCRAPVQPVSAAGPAPGTTAAAGAYAAQRRGEAEENLGAGAGAQSTEAAEAVRSGGVPERAVRRATSMVALPLRAWPDLSFRAPASASGREEDMRGLGKIMRLLKLSDSVEMAGVGAARSVSLGAGSCHRLPTRSGPSAAGASADEMSQ